MTRSLHRSWHACWQRDCWWECGCRRRTFGTAWLGSPTQKDDRIGNSGKEPSACRVATTSLVAPRRKSLPCIAEELVVDINDGTVGESQCAKRSGYTAVCRKTIDAVDVDDDRDRQPE